MLNTNRVRGILRARKGSQIPKFKLPAGPIINNNALIGSTEAKPFKPLPTMKDLINVITPQDFMKLSLPKSIQDRYDMEKEALDKITNEKAKIRAAKGLANGTHTVSNGEVVYDLREQVIDPLMDKADDLLFNVGDISKKYPDMVGAGIDLIGSQFNDVENSSGVSTVFNAADMVTNGLMSVNPAVGLIGKAALTAFKGINSLGGKYSDSFSANQDTIAQVGSSYGGSVADINNAASKAGKKYGLFSGRARRNANRQITEARRQQNIMTDIADEASMQNAMSGNDLNYINYQFDINGGYDQRYMRAAKSGMKIQDKINFVKQRRFNTRINLDTKEIEWEPTIDDIADYWEPVIDDISRYKEGGKTKEELETPEIEETTQKNLIPEGALHKNKHHMEHTEGLTQKGIPVIDNEGEQQAEIELDEIIFTLEVTKKLEELYKDGSDEAAIEAGKLLVKEILFNTDDRTGLISKCERGGKL